MLSDLVLILMLVLIFVLLIFSVKIFSDMEKLSLDQEAIKGAIATCWKELGVDQDIGAIKEKAEDIARTAQNLENLFRVPYNRGVYGEFQLECILKDILPSKYVHIRKKVSQLGKVPDAHIVTPQGIICIDSKFPLDNYRRMLEAKDEDRETYRVRFRKDVKMHIEKIKTDYVKPEKGTVSFAFGFIPSEAVYQYLTEHEIDLVVEAANEGVLLVSPATLVINLNLINIGLRAAEISEKAKEIQNNLNRIKSAIEELEKTWEVLYNHIRNAYNKASEVNKKHEDLKNTIEQIVKFEEANTVK